MPRVDNEIKQAEKRNIVKMYAFIGMGGVFLSILIYLVFSNYSLKREMAGLQEGRRDEILVYLPSDLYVAAGQSMELYNNEVIWAGNMDNYHVSWNCELGQNLARKYSLTALEENIGVWELELNVYDNNMKPVYNRTVNLHIVADNIPEGIRILNIGDSLSSTGIWYERVRELSSGKISFVGTRGYEECMHEGRPGFAAGSYLSEIGYERDGETVHPFWNPEEGRFDYQYYKDTYNIDPDVVQIWLGVNGMKLDPADNAKAIKTIVDSVRQDDPEIPIYIVNTPYLSGQDGIGYQQDIYGYIVLQGTWKLEEDRKIMNLMLELEEELGDYRSVYFIPAAIMHDSENNYKTLAVPVNPESSGLCDTVVESVHPEEAGYRQIAGCMYGVYCGTMDGTLPLAE